MKSLSFRTVEQNSLEISVPFLLPRSYENIFRLAPTTLASPDPTVATNVYKYISFRVVRRYPEQMIR